MLTFRDCDAFWLVATLAVADTPLSVALPATEPTVEIVVLCDRFCEVAVEVEDDAPVPPAAAETPADCATDAASPAEVALLVAVAVLVTGYSPAIIQLPSYCVSSVTAAPAALRVVEKVPSVIVSVFPEESSGSTATMRR